MIHLGQTPETKRATIDAYRRAHGLTSAVMLSPAKFAFPVDFETVDWPDIIEYRFFYRLVQEVDAGTLVVINECLRTKNRYDLTYNCIRHILNQAGHVLVFQWLPIIDDMQDFMVLFDWVTRSRWKRERFDPELLAETTLDVTPRPVTLEPIRIQADAKTRAQYAAEKAKLFANLGLKDPHTLPRQLHLIGGRLRAGHADFDAWHLARNNRFKLDRVQTYKEPAYPHRPYTLMDFPHNTGDLVDALSLAQQTHVPALVTDLPVDAWYLDRYTTWTGRLADAYASLS